MIAAPPPPPVRLIFITATLRPWERVIGHTARADAHGTAPGARAVAKRRARPPAGVATKSARAMKRVSVVPQTVAAPAVHARQPLPIITQQVKSVTLQRVPAAVIMMAKGVLRLVGRLVAVTAATIFAKEQSHQHHVHLIAAALPPVRRLSSAATRAFRGLVTTRIVRPAAIIIRTVALRPVCLAAAPVHAVTARAVLQNLKRPVQPIVAIFRHPVLAITMPFVIPLNHRPRVPEIVAAARLPQQPVLPTVITPPQAATRVTTPPVRTDARMGATVVQAVARRVSAPITASTCRAQWRVT